MVIKQLAENYNDYIIAQRRYFHARPELSFEETQTTADIQRQLEEIGIPVKTFSDYNGLIGTIKGGLPGKTVMLRADIDALPSIETTGLPYSSQNAGKMHACGHDAHIAMLLGAAKILWEIRASLKGEVALFFQAAEESCHGAEYYIAHGVLDNIDAVFGMHIWGGMNSPLMSLEEGPRMASCDNFKITVEGVAAHGSAPHLGSDAIVAAASVIMNLQTLVSRVNDPRNTLVVSVGTIHGGQRLNIIANRVEMEGTIRTFSREFRESIRPQLEKIIVSTAEALGCKASLAYYPYAGPVINDHADLNRIARAAAVKLYGEEILAPLQAVTGSEDFAYLMEKTPGFYGFIGALNPDKGIIYSNHHDKFTVDEDALHRGAALYAQFAADFLAEA